MDNPVVILIVAIVMIVAVAIPVTIQTVGSVTALTGVANETLSLNTSNQPGNQFNNQSFNLANGNIVQVATVRNATGQVVLTSGSNYSTLLGYDSTRQAYNSTIVFTRLNVSNMTGPVIYVSYTYQPSTYDYNAGNRQLYALLPLGLAVGALVVVFGALG